MEKLQKAQNGSPRRSSNDYRCSFCLYTSSRRYNIIRHESRIHYASSRPRKCCDIIFKTKGEYYVHCEEKHPNSRLTNRTSRYKYRILPEMMIPKSGDTRVVRLSPKNHPEMRRYVLRRRVRPMNYCEEEPKIEHSESASPKSSESLDESELDAEMEHSRKLHQSSGYGTTNSISTKFDSTEENIEIKVKSFENGNITAGFGESSTIGMTERFNELNVPSFEHRIEEKNVSLKESSDLTEISVYPQTDIDSNQSNTIESDDIKTSSENELKENHCTPLTLTINKLPPKKRILLSLGFSNSENIKGEAMDDRLYLSTPLSVEQTPLRKKHRLSKKQIKCRKLRKIINLSEYSSASDDAENLPPPPTTADPRKQKIPGLEVNLRANVNHTWDQITQLMWEHVRSFDFDKF